MPTTQPLDEDELGDIAEGPLKAIAGFAQPGAVVQGAAPRAAVPDSAAKMRTASQGMQSGQSNSARTAPSLAANTPRGGMKLNLNRPALNVNTQKPTPSGVKPATDTTATATPAATGQKPYTDADVLTAWQRFIDENEPERLLVNAMRMAKPRRSGADTFRIAQSRVHLDIIREHIDRLTRYMHQRTGNGNIRFEFEEISEDSPLAWNERELLEHIVKENPAVGDFIKAMRLKLL